MRVDDYARPTLPIARQIARPEGAATVKYAFTILGALLLPPPAAAHAAEPLLVERLEGPVTAAEIRAFKSFMREVPAPTNNLHNAMVYGGGGMAVEALARMVEISGDRELLDLTLAFTDRMLAGRNDPHTGAIIWTGQRELVWPNREPENGQPVYAGAETGDVVGHVAYAAKLILQQEKLRDAKVGGGDPYGFGATYGQRAMRYVREMDRTIDGFVLNRLVQPRTLRYFTPDSPAYEASSRPGAGNRPVPWNQQMMLNNGFQRLAECHVLLADDADRVRRYEAVVRTSVQWFFSMAKRVTVNGHACCQWAYLAEEPLRHLEDAGHGGEDIAGLYRAYLGRRYGISAAMMEPLANTVLYVMRQPDGKFVGRVDGTAGKHPPGGLRGNWLDLCEFAPELFTMLYEINRGRIKSSPDIAAGILWHRQRRAALPK